MDSSVFQKTNTEIQVDTKVSFHERTIQQIEQEYWASWWFMKPKWDEWQNRLKLYNNQKRNKDRVGSPDVFTFHQTLLAHLYDDRLRVTFGGRQEEDEEIAENLTLLAENDYDEMKMSQLDYEWDFDASLYGRGLMLMNDWDYDSQTPMAEVIDPMVWFRDPNAQSVNGNRMGLNAMRFGGREIRRTYSELFDSGDYFNLEYLKNDAQGFRTFSPLWDAERARKEAQGFNIPYQSYSLQTNLDWTLLQWFTLINGVPYMIELGNDRTLIIRMVKLGNKWPIIDRTMYPIAHDWDGVSVFDVTEDKQRFRAQLINIYGDTAKSMLYPMYLFDENKIRKNIDKDFDFDKWLPVDGNPNDAATPLKKAGASNEVNFMLDFLDKAGSKALGINEPITQPGKKQTLGQQQMAQAKIDARTTLQLKIWGWSEEMKWQRWYDQYQENMPGGIASKILRIQGASGREWKKIKKEDLTANHVLGPKIDIETKSVSEARRLREYSQMKDFLMEAVNLPETDKTYGIRKLGEKVLKKSEVRLLIPFTFDERVSLGENEKLNEGTHVGVAPEDNHLVHLRIHEQCDDTPEAEDHIKRHELALMIKRVAPQMFPPMTPDGQNPLENPGSGASKPKAQPLASPAAEGIGMTPIHK